MKKAAVLFAEGFEEVEALTVVDLLRRAGVGCDIIALDDAKFVVGTHGIVIGADKPFSGTTFDDYDALLLPGGQPGTERLAADERVKELLVRFHASGRLTAAICAAPTVLAKAGLLRGKCAVCYPGLENELTEAKVAPEPVVTDGTIITSRGVGTAIPFALAIVKHLCGVSRAEDLARSIVYL